MAKIVRYPSMSLNSILSKNKKDKQYMKKETHKSNALRFWITSGVIPLCRFGYYSAIY